MPDFWQIAGMDIGGEGVACRAGRLLHLRPDRLIARRAEVVIEQHDSGASVRHELQGDDQ